MTSLALRAYLSGNITSSAAVCGEAHLDICICVSPNRFICRGSGGFGRGAVVSGHFREPVGRSIYAVKHVLFQHLCSKSQENTCFLPPPARRASDLELGGTGFDSRLGWVIPDSDRSFPARTGHSQGQQGGANHGGWGWGNLRPVACDHT